MNRSGYQLKLSHFLSTGWGPLHINNPATSLKRKGYDLLTPLMPWSELGGYE